MTTRPARVGRQTRPRGLLGRDRGLQLLGDPLADVRRQLVERPQRLVVGLVALEPLVERADVDGVHEPVARRVRGLEHGRRRVDGRDRLLVLRLAALLGGDPDEPVVLRELRREQAGRRAARLEPRPRPVQAVRRRRHALERGVALPELGRHVESAPGASPTYGAAASSARIAADSERTRAMSPLPSAMAASIVSVSPPTIAARAPRACVPSASMSADSASTERLGRVEMLRGPRRSPAEVELGPRGPVRARLHRDREPGRPERDRDDRDQPADGPEQAPAASAHDSGPGGPARSPRVRWSRRFARRYPRAPSIGRGSNPNRGPMTSSGPMLSNRSWRSWSVATGNGRWVGLGRARDERDQRHGQRDDARAASRARGRPPR